VKVKKISESGFAGFKDLRDLRKRFLNKIQTIKRFTGLFILCNWGNNPLNQ
jgi:hypothetical protein